MGTVTPGVALLVDMRTGRLSFLMTGSLGFRALGEFSWAPDMSRGVASLSSEVCSTLVWLTSEAVEELNLLVPRGGRLVRIDASDFSGSGCDGHPRADKPAWSPDVSRIAFFFSPASPNVSGQDRLDVPWDLYLIDPDGSSPERHVAGIAYPSAPQWSPDGRWLLFSGEIASEGLGTWIYSPDRRRMTRFTSDVLDWVAWSPEGDRIVGILSDAPASESSRLVVYRVSELLG